jgi:hypothetical protein
MLLRSLLVIGLALSLTGFVDAAKGAKKNKKSSSVQGLVKGAEADKDKEGGTLTVQAKGKKGAPGDEKKITVTKETKIEKVAAPAKGEKKKKTELKGEAAKFSDISSNSQVLVTLKSGSDNVAEKVVVLPAKKAKKKKNNA